MAPSICEDSDSSSGLVESRNRKPVSFRSGRLPLKMFQVAMDGAKLHQRIHLKLIKNEVVFRHDRITCSLTLPINQGCVMSCSVCNPAKLMLGEKNEGCRECHSKLKSGMSDTCHRCGPNDVKVSGCCCKMGSLHCPGKHLTVNAQNGQRQLQFQRQHTQMHVRRLLRVNGK